MGRRGFLEQLWAFLILLLAAAAASAAATVPTTDTQWWQELDLTAELSQHLSVLVAGFTRFSDHDPNPALTGGGAFVTWKQGVFGYSLGYLHAQVRAAGSGARIDADLPVAALSGTLERGQVRITDQIRVEELIGLPRDPWRYRNLVSVSYALAESGLIKKLLISDEVFVAKTTGLLTRNRLLAGPVFAVSKRATIGAAYVNERDVRKAPGRIRGALISAAFSLN